MKEYLETISPASKASTAGVRSLFDSLDATDLRHILPVGSISLFSDSGKSLATWRKRPNGEWKCVVDTWNSDIAPPPAK